MLRASIPGRGAALLQRQAAPCVTVSQKRHFSEKFVPSQMPIVKKKWNTVNVIKTTTETMRNVAAGKLPGCERFLKMVRPWASIVTPFFEIEKTPPKEQTKKILHIGLTTERGLCGNVGSNIPKTIALRVKDDEEGKYEHFVCVYGKKGMGNLQGMVPMYLPQMDIGFGNMKMKDPHFAYVCETVDKIGKMNINWDVAQIYYNTYKNSSVFQLTQKNVYRMDICEQIAEVQLPAYEVEGNEGEILENLLEYKLACTLYLGLAEQFASEQGCRLQSMDGAVKACRDKGNEYEKIYMKLRQTKITSELTVLAAGVKCIAMAAGE